MKYRSQYALAALIGLAFMLFCFSQESQAASDPPRNAGDVLLGEWRVKCAVKVYQNGGPYRVSQDNSESVVVIESDPDGSYQLYKFPVGFGEGFPRLRKVSANQYAGEDTVRGITIFVKQNVELENDRITIRQSVIDAPGNQPQTDTECTGTRLRLGVEFPATSHAVEVCPAGLTDGGLPDRKLARRYQSVKPFSEGLAAVAIAHQGTRSKKWGFIDKTGRVVIPMRYDVVTSFNGGLAAAGKFCGRGRKLKWGVVEKLGPQVTPHMNYDAVKILGEGFAAVGYAMPGRAGLKWNLINRENTTVFHGFDDIKCFVGGRARASYTDGKVVRVGHVNKVGDFFEEKK